tara:strand:- start:947 stop:1360 length:414 start_codon:yes stop_codon:yes gene_type:complete
MKTITMSKNQAAELYNGLVDVKDLKSKNFALKAVKNMTAIKEALQDIEELGKPTDEFMELSLRVQTIVNEDPDNGKERIEKLEKENIELVEQRKSQLELVNERLLEDVDLELDIFSEDVLPDEITTDQINKLIKLIE